ncbi:hypothetical protein HYFRA_00001199 [Hymenoscyphus fraxineus]|uniref:AA9 family lytic polysaccharide monooxygenase n=1 Tax=Hymenoscyphus fraxineus TaxID=746836 RepID=A0A9N9KVV1_9HELO|nr:hypothetical protein HYFRA_00001199 [Hymenoscyphus fraxineus]
MRYSEVLASSALMAVASAHTWIFQASVNGVDQGVGSTAAGIDAASAYVRVPPNNSPIKKLDDPNLACNVNGDKPVAKTIDVPEGADVILQWFHNKPDPGDDILDKSHVGPVMAYLAPTASNGAGDVWVKIAEEGFSGGKWATDNLIAARGKQSVKIPAGLAPGEYLLRGEIIALHEGDSTEAKGRGAQLYMECVQIKVTGSGTTPLPAGVAIPGVYKTEDPGILFNVYGKFDSYPIPGPRPLGAAGAAPAGAPPAGDKPAGAPPASTPVATPAPVKKNDATPTPAPAGGEPVKDSCNVKKESTPTTLDKVTVKATPAPGGESGGTVAKYGQCGGSGFTGSTQCETGSTCTSLNEFYSQCT